MTEAKKTAEQRIAEAQERREKRRDARNEKEAEQFATDLEALEQLEAEHSDTKIGAVKVTFVEGQPTRAFFRMPTRAQYKRYTDQVGRGVTNKDSPKVRDAQDTLAKSVWIYPAEQQDKEAMLEAIPGLLTSIALAAAKMAEGAEEEEGKG